MAKVFIASRFAADGLQDLRLRLSAELTRRGAFQPINLDDNVADPRSSKTRSIDLLRQSDCVVLLLGESYPDVAEGTISITEQEFEEAQILELPIYAYEIADFGAMDPRARRFAERVREDYTVCRLDPTALDLGTISADLLVTRYQTGDSGEGVEDYQVAEGIFDRLKREAKYLGFDREVAERGPLREQGSTAPTVMQQRRYAFEALQLGSAPTSLVHLKRSLEIFSLDWTSTFCAAWLTNSSGRRKDLRASLDYAEAAAQSAMTSVDHAVLRRRRLAASLALVSRNARRLDLLGLAEESTAKALKLQPWSQSVMTEDLMLAAAANDSQRAALSAEALYRRYPTYCLRILPMRELVPVRLAIEGHLRVCMEGLIGLFGGTLPDADRPLIELKSATKLAFNSYKERVGAIILGEVERATGLCSGLVHLEPVFKGEFACRNDVDQRVETLEVDIAQLATRFSRDEAMLAHAPACLGLARFPVESLLLGLTARRRDAERDLQATHERISALRQVVLTTKRLSDRFWILGGLSLLLFLLAGSSSGGNALVWLLGALALGVEPVRELRGRRQAAANSSLMAQLEAQYSHGYPAYGELMRQENNAVNLVAIGVEVASKRSRQEQLTALRDGAPEIDGLKASLVTLLETNSEVVRCWVQILEPSRYRPEYRAKPGDITSVLPSSNAGGLRSTSQRSRVVWAVFSSTPEASFRDSGQEVVTDKPTIKASDLACFAPADRRDRVIAFERWLVSYRVAIEAPLSPPGTNGARSAPPQTAWGPPRQAAATR
jgi:Domain of unknown function (DUF4062)